MQLVSVSQKKVRLQLDNPESITIYLDCVKGWVRSGYKFCYGREYKGTTIELLWEKIENDFKE